MPDTVLVITNDHDEHADAVIRELDKRAVPVFRFYPAEFPESYSLSIEIRDGRIEGEIRDRHHGVAFDDICAAWYRRWHRLFAPVPSLNMQQGDLENFVGVQSSATVTALFASLKTLWVGQPSRLRHADIKALQLVEASKAGLLTPATLISNHPKRAASFVNALGNAECAVKPLVATRVDFDEGARLPLTTTLPRGHALDSVALAPTILQPYIEKAYELRCVVMGDKIHTAKLKSQEKASARKDWRAAAVDPDGKDVEYEVYDLPEPVCAAIHRMMRSFGINFASLDLIVTPEGEFVFLDLNPNGQWLWLEEQLGLPLVASMADLLTTHYTPAAEPVSRWQNEAAYGA